MKRKNQNKITIYIDHWEDYQSIGDKAMLLNSLRRLELHLGPCLFVGPLSPKKEDEFYRPSMQTVPAPHLEILRYAGWLKKLYTKLSKLLPSRIRPKVVSKDYLNVSIAFLAFKHVLYSLGVRCVFRESFRSFLEVINNCDIFFTVGDCSLSDYWLDGVILKSWLIKFVRPYVTVSVLSSQGIGPLETHWARRRLIKSLKTLDILSFRDFSYSKNLVNSEGLTEIPNQIVGDEAFSYPVADQTDIKLYLEKEGISDCEPFIIVNFRHTDFTQNTTALLEKAANLLDHVIKITKKKIVFICMSKGDYYGQDYQAGLHIKEIMKHYEQFNLLEPIDDISLVKGVIGTAAYSMGLSYHLHVFSLSQGHPTLILYSGEYYKTKSEGLTAFYTLPIRAVNFKEESIEQTLSYINEIEENYAIACKQDNVENQKILANNDWTIAKLKNILIEKGVLDREKTC